MSKIDQLAYYAHNDKQVKQIQEYYGLQNANWVTDDVEGVVEVYNLGQEVLSGLSHGFLRFNYDLGIELEILTYLSGPHWHMPKAKFQSGEPFLSHIGLHMDVGENLPIYSTPANIVQRMWTEKHTNPYLVEKQRKYFYEIHDTSAMLGHDTKYIWRIEQ